MPKVNFKGSAEFTSNGILKKFTPRNISKLDIDVKNEQSDPLYREKKEEISFPRKKNIKKLVFGLTQLRKKLTITEKERGV